MCQTENSKSRNVTWLLFLNTNDKTKLFPSLRIWDGWTNSKNLLFFLPFWLLVVMKMPKCTMRKTWCSRAVILHCNMLHYQSRAEMNSDGVCGRQLKLLWRETVAELYSWYLSNWPPVSTRGRCQNIARGTTDPGYWVYNLNNFSDWNQFEITLVGC